jgi:hypothetical protein
MDLSGSSSPGLSSRPQLHQLDKRRRRRPAAADAELDEFGHFDPARTSSTQIMPVTDVFTSFA